MYTVQQLGLITTTVFSNHMLRAHKKVKSRPPNDDERTKCGPLLLDDAYYLITDSCQFDNPGNDVEAPVDVSPHSSVIVPRA